MMIHQIERDLVFDIADDKMEIIMLIGQLRMTCQIAKDADYLKILLWLSKNRYRGQRFLDLFKVRFERSMLNLIAWTRKKIYNDTQARRVFKK